MGLRGKSKGKIYDLGSGGGVPALVLIEKLKEWEFVLIERKKKEQTFYLKLLVFLTPLKESRLFAMKLKIQHGMKNFHLELIL